MYPKGNKMIFSESDIRLAKVPEEAPTTEAARYKGKICAQAAEVELQRSAAAADPIRGASLAHELEERLLQLQNLSGELTAVIKQESDFDKAIGQILEQG